jgi:hypothetical protein
MNLLGVFSHASSPAQNWQPSDPSHGRTVHIDKRFRTAIGAFGKRLGSLLRIERYPIVASKMPLLSQPSSLSFLSQPAQMDSQRCSGETICNERASARGGVLMIIFQAIVLVVQRPNEGERHAGGRDANCDNAAK